jgi:hypothetical protein
LALHASGDVFAHHQEHFTVFTASDNIHPSCCWLVSWMMDELKLLAVSSSMTPAGSNLSEHYQIL